MNKRLFVILALFAFLGVMPSFAQDDVSTGVEITWPTAVTEVWGTGDVMGTAAVPGMAYYFLEYLLLNDDLSFPDSAPWIPVTVGIENTVRNGVLATLDTTEVADGLYALRLVVTTRSGEVFTHTVSPVRVSNERFERITEEITNQALEDAGLSPTEEAPEPTATPPDTTPHVTPAGAATNVRRCDIVDNQACPILDFLSQGEYAAILAVSSNSTGWFQIRMPSGLVGWVSPAVVVTSGDLSNLPRVVPPQPIPPPAAANVIPNAIAIEGNVAVCARTFNVQINVANIGNLISSPGSVSLQNVHIRTGTVAFTSFGNFPTINPGGNFVVVIPVTVTVFFNEEHELRAFIGNQQVTMRYILQQGTCGIPGTLPPAPTPVPTQPPPTEPPPTAPPTEVPPTEPPDDEAPAAEATPES